MEDEVGGFLCFMVEFLGRLLCVGKVGLLFTGNCRVGFNRNFVELFLGLREKLFLFIKYFERIVCVIEKGLFGN